MGVTGLALSNLGGLFEQANDSLAGRCPVERQSTIATIDRPGQPPNGGKSKTIKGSRLRRGHSAASAIGMASLPYSNGDRNMMVFQLFDTVKNFARYGFSQGPRVRSTTTDEEKQYDGSSKESGE